MTPFSFYNPTRILFGEGSIAQLARHVPAEARVLVTYGGGSVLANGTLDQVRAALSGRQLSEFGGIEPNPQYDTLLRAVAQARASQCDFVLAVGGGSVIDGSKFIAAALCHDGDPLTILTSFGRCVRAAVPLGCVLTLAATGSEMNNGAVISVPAQQAKLYFASEQVFPRFAVLDPTRGHSLPARQLGNGVVDAFVHVLEQYLTYPQQASVQDRLAEGLLLALREEGPRVLANPQDTTAQANLMWSASLALNGLIGAGVAQDWSTHMIGHELTALYGIDHARTLAIILPANLQERRHAKRDKLLQYATRVWQLPADTADASIDQAIALTAAFFESLGVPTRLSAYQLDAGCIETVVQQLTAHGMTQLGEQRDVTSDVVRRILQRAL